MVAVLRCPGYLGREVELPEFHATDECVPLLMSERQCWAVDILGVSDFDRIGADFDGNADPDLALTGDTGGNEAIGFVRVPQVFSVHIWTPLQGPIRNILIFSHN